MADAAEGTTHDLVGSPIPDGGDAGRALVGIGWVRLAERAAAELDRVSRRADHGVPDERTAQGGAANPQANPEPREDRL